MRLKSLAVVAFALSAAPAFADGDAVAGRTVFKKCQPCHEAARDASKVGPSLLGVMDRTAGTLMSFAGKFSPAMVEAGAKGLAWDDANMAAYMKAPREFIPGNRMAFAGLKKDEDIADLIAYLRADPKP